MPLPRVAAVAALLLIVAASSVAPAQPPTSPIVDRPTAMRLLPQETMLLVRTPAARELITRVKQTASGRMLQDPQLEAFVQRMYGVASDFYAEEAEEKVGVSLEELERLPQGEVAFAIVRRQEAEPAFLFFADLGDQNHVGSQLLDRALEMITEQGGTVAEESIAGVNVRVVRDGDNQDRTIGIAQVDNTLFLTTDPNLMRLVLERYQGIEPAEDPDPAQSENEPNEQQSDYTGALAKNADFATILSTFRQSHDDPPQLIYYVDPIGLIREFSRDNAGVRVVLATFPALGLDGLLGVGGSMSFATGDYDDISHFHVLLDNPRSGVMRLINFLAAETRPQDWVPAGIETYSTWSFDFALTYERLVALVDKFRYEGSMEKLVNERLSEPLGIDFRSQVLDNLAGRVGWFIAYETPPRLRSQRHVIGFEVKDAEQAQQSLDAVVAKYPSLFEQRQFGEVTYQAMIIEGFAEMPEDERPMAPAFAVIDDYLFVSGSCQLLERAIEARDGTRERLADAIGYKLMASKLRREIHGSTPALVMFNQPDKSLQHWYEYILDEKNRAYFAENAEENPFFAALHEAVEADELPPFEVLSKYFAPSGTVLYDTDTGFHATAYTFRRGE